MLVGAEGQASTSECERPVDVLTIHAATTGGSLYLPGSIDGNDVTCLIDSGATLSVMHTSIYRSMDPDSRTKIRPREGHLRMADGGLVKPLGQIDCRLMLPDQRCVTHSFVVADIEAQIVLGIDFLQMHEAILDAKCRLLQVNGVKYNCTSENELPHVFRIRISETVTVPPLSEMVLPCYMPERPPFPTRVLETAPKCCEQNKVVIAHTVSHTNTETVPVRLIDLSNEPQVLYENQVAAPCEQSNQ